METTTKKTIWDVIKEHKESASLSARLIGRAPTNEWTGLATAAIQGALLDLGYEFTRFYSNVKGQPLYKKLCICFVTFNKPPE